MRQQLRAFSFAFVAVAVLVGLPPGGAQGEGAPANTAGKADDLIAQSRAAHARAEPDKALALADQAVAADPANPRPYALRASLAEESRDFAKAAADYGKVLELSPGSASAYQRRGAAYFRSGQVEKSIHDFDQYLKANPDEEPHHWQRGISYYYAGRFEDGRRQFESHKAVNPNDVENAAWHYLCLARAQGVEKAKAALIPIEGDRRVPMMTIHALFAGKAKPEDVLAAAEAGEGRLAPAEVDGQRFYAHLYLGLYFEAAGDAEKARRHITLAAEKHPQDHYMGDVARVHLQQFRRTKE